MTTIQAFFLLLMALPKSVHDTEGAPERQGRMWVTAHAIVLAARDEREALMLLTQGYAETRFAQAVHQGQCRPGTCDYDKRTKTFRAASFWQLHVNERNREEWSSYAGASPEATFLAAKHAAFLLRRCRGTAEAFQAQGGGRCERGPRGEHRAAMLEQARTWLRAVRLGRAVRVTWD